MRNYKYLIALTMFLPTISHADNSNSCAAFLKLGVYNLAHSENVVDSELLKKSSFCAYDYNKIQTSPAQMALIEDAYKLFGNVGGTASLAQITEVQTRLCTAAGFGSDIYRVQAAPISQNVYQTSLDAWNNCQSLAKEGVNFNLQPDSTMQSVTVTLSTNSTGMPATLNNLQQTGTGRSICEATLPPRNGSFSGKTIAVDKTTSLKFDSSNKLTITCQRQMLKTGNDFSADEQSLIFNTSIGSYQVPMAAIGSLSRMSVDKATTEIQTVISADVSKQISGMIVPFNLTSCPSSWSPADGKNGTPDLRGEFVRGFDNDRGVDAGRGIGSFQDHQLQTHTHRVIDGLVQSVYMGAISSDIYAPVFGTGARVDNYPESTAPHGANIGAETRPRNVALLYCVKN